MLKVWRDAVALGATSLSLIVLMLVGTALYVLFDQARVNLEASYVGFYHDMHFADATVLVEEAPESLVDQAKLVPGVTEALGRAVKDGTIILRARPRRRVQGRFVGLPQNRHSPINDVQVVDGTYLSERNECLVSQLFAEANHLRVGDILTCSYLGRRHDFVIAGIAASPEYLYPVPSKEAPFVSPTTFGVCWIDEDEARQWLGLGRSITEVHTLCRPGTEQQVLGVLESLGEPYGLRSSWDEAGQPSNNLLQLDIHGFRAMSIAFPMLFMFAAGLSLYSSLTRVVRLQTGIVGFLRASGFDSRQVLWHYVLQGGLLTGSGALPGLLIGHWGSIGMLHLYATVIHVPVMITRAHPDSMLKVTVAAMAVGWLAAWLPARAAARTPPAVAMRGSEQADSVVHLPWLEVLTARVPTLFRISLRGLTRRPSRTLFAVGGLTCGASLLLATLGMYASTMDAMDRYIYEALRYELDVAFVAPSGEDLADAVGALPGVDGVVKTCLAAARIQSPYGHRTIQIQGIERGQRAMAMRTVDGRPVDLKPGELWLTEHNARTLHVEPGDPLQVEWAFSSRRKPVRTTMRVGGVIKMEFGSIAYGEYHDIRRRLVDRVYPEAIYGAWILCPRPIGNALRLRLERDELVAAVLSTGDIKDEIEKQMGVTYTFITVLVLFGLMLSGAVLHSVSSISVLERMRELATMRSLGFSARSTTWAAAVEIYAMALLALAVGLPLGVWMNDQFMGLYQTENFAWDAIMPLGCYLTVVGMVFGLVAVSLQSGVKRLRTMDLAQATKARE